MFGVGIIRDLHILTLAINQRMRNTRENPGTMR